MYRSVLAALLLATTQACVFSIDAEIDRGNGRWTEESRVLAPFSAVRADGPLLVDVDSTTGTADAILYCDANLMEDIELEVVDGVLEIGVRGMFRPSSTCRVQVFTPARVVSAEQAGTGELVVHTEHVEVAILSGSGVVLVQGYSEVAAFEAWHTGSGELGLHHVVADSMLVHASGSGTVHGFDGEVGVLAVELAGSGAVAMEPMAVDEAFVALTGSGSVVLTVSEAVQAIIDGSGSVTIHGDPAERDVSGAGSGVVVFE